MRAGSSDNVSDEEQLPPGQLGSCNIIGRRQVGRDQEEADVLCVGAMAR